MTDAESARFLLSQMRATMTRDEVAAAVTSAQVFAILDLAAAVRSLEPAFERIEIEGKTIYLRRNPLAAVVEHPPGSNE